MRDLAFPARKKYIEFNGGLLTAPKLEVYSSREISGSFIERLGQIEFSSGIKQHYLVPWSSESLDAILSNIELPGPVNAYLKSQPYERKRNIPKIMAVANATPDSFYAGSRIGNDPGQLQEIIDASPDIIDVGAESTRPGSAEISVAEEIERLRPVISYLRKNSEIPLSLDTRHSKVLEEFGSEISYINDVSGFSDPGMIQSASALGLKCITMHMRGEPGNMQTMTEYNDVFPEVLSFLAGSAERLTEAGVKANDIYLDPGIGFAKDLQGNLELIRDAGSLKIGYCTLFGTSRKSFLGKITGKQTEERLPATLATTAYLAGEGVDIIRVHDVKENLDVVKVIGSIIRSGN